MSQENEYILGITDELVSLVWETWNLISRYNFMGRPVNIW